MLGMCVCVCVCSAKINDGETLWKFLQIIT